MKSIRIPKTIWSSRSTKWKRDLCLIQWSYGPKIWMWDHNRSWGEVYVGMTSKLNFMSQDQIKGDKEVSLSDIHPFLRSKHFAGTLNRSLEFNWDFACLANAVANNFKPLRLQHLTELQLELLMVLKNGRQQHSKTLIAQWEPEERRRKGKPEER